MNHLLTWLTDNVRNATKKCGALGASIYIPTPWAHPAPAILLHVGTVAPLPELADIDAAAAFSARLASTPAAARRRRSLSAGYVESLEPSGCLIPIPMVGVHWRIASPTFGDGAVGTNPRRRLADADREQPCVGWLGLRFADRFETPCGARDWPSMLDLASALASTYVSSYGILTDPVTGLPGRTELNATLRTELERLKTGGTFALLFVKIEGLDRINEQRGRATGDAVLRSFLDIVQSAVRKSDVVMRYGGAVFALPLRDVGESAVVTIGEKIRRRVSSHHFGDDATMLACAVGAYAGSAQETAALQPIDLMRRADQALAQSRRQGGTRVVVWESGNTSRESLDPLVGVFTGDAEKDYRNMRLLWEVVAALSTLTGDALAETAVDRIFTLFDASRVGLFRVGAEQSLALTAGRRRQPGTTAPATLTAAVLSSDEWDLNRRAFASGEPQVAALSSALAGAAEGRERGYAAPLVVAGRAIGTLYLRTVIDATKMDATDVPVLSGVVTHLALALDRERLASEQHSREQAAMRAELERLRASLPTSTLVFQSPQMTGLLETTRRVATTDATVLITGESGTGKEMLAHTLHSLSLRHRKPLVIVDCAAIPASLIDSELFGRERGAYTGAERRTAGRLAQADGGTVFLDEIGELPLEVQAKLLRFVQEKTITMVGMTQSQRVDVRIVAATNRALEEEVKAGRFRGDLFHRLNVVRLQIPSLCERRDDVLMLAEHFLRTFSAQHGKPLNHFDADAKACLLDYPWPGNVRELQNTVLRAVLLSSRDAIGVEDLKLSPEVGGAASHTTPPPPVVVSVAPDERIEASDWSRLREALQRQVAACRRSGRRLPLGTWLDYTTALAAFEHAGGVISRAAQRLDLPDSTFARRLRQAQADAECARYPESWAEVQQAVAALMRSEVRQPLMARRIEQTLIAIVAETQCPASEAAALLGLSVPTVKRRLGEGASALVGQAAATAITGV